MLSRVTRRDLLNVIGPFLSAYGIVSFLCFFLCVQWWARAAPRMLDPAHGFVYPHNEHGSISYFSAFQTTSCTLLLLTSMPVLCVGALLTPRHDPVFRRGVRGMEVKWDPDDPTGLQRFGFAGGMVAAPLLIFVVGRILVKALNAAGFVWPFS